MRRFTIMLVAAVIAALALPLGASAASAAEIAHEQVVNPNPANNTPHVLDGEVNSIAQVGNLVILGGSFTQVSNAQRTQTYQRRNVVAFNATTGVIDAAFNPSPDSAVTTVIPSADAASIYLGGNFNSVAGQTRRKVARVDLATGANTAGFRNVAANGIVKDLRLVDGRLWVAGAFTSMSGSSQASLATLDAETGNANGYMTLPIEGQHNGGTTQVIKIDVTPDGDRLVGIGNFRTVGGEAHRQIVMLDTSGPAASLPNWRTTFYEGSCAGVFNTYMRDLDFAPDGSFFVVTTTGAYGGATSACDTQARFDTGRTGTAVAPEWINTTGGDTTYAVEVTGAAVYVGGHMRWENNPFAGDSPGAGSVSREGIAALDPVNGMPFSWNPTRTRGVGVFDMLATSSGLWIGSDTEWVGGENHMRVAFFPLAGGKTVAPTVAPALPANVVLLAPQAAAGTDHVLYRVNAGGGAVGSLDSGADWAADDAGSSPYRVGGGNVAGYNPGVAFDATVPGSAPSALFDQERWDDGGSPEMQWTFPIAAGTPIQVRLYFANRYDGTAAVGTRLFDVRLDGSLVLDDFDIVAAAGGTNTATMRSFDLTSDGQLNIDFGHVVENPLINAIEILRTDVAPVDTTHNVRTMAFSGTQVAAMSEETTTVDWSGARGAFMLNGSVYIAHADGSFVRRSYDGSAWGAPVTVNTQDQLVPLTAWQTNASRITGLFFDNGRMYFTQTGSASLRMRYFTAENDVVGAVEYSAAPSVAGLDLSRVRGMFLAGEWVFVVQPDGSLQRVGWQDGAFVPGSVTTVSGPAIDGVSWLAKVPFAYQSSDGSAPNFPPTAQATVTCEFQACTFSAEGSNDVGGSIVGYAWNFGDGATSTEANPVHSYAAAGTYTVTLTVTDNAGASTTISTEKEVEFLDQLPSASFVTSCENRVCAFDASGSSDAEGPIEDFAWTFGDGGSASGAQVSHTFAADGDFDVTLTVEDGAGQSAQSMQSIRVEHVFSAPVASFTMECSSLTCVFDGSASSDADGPLVGYAWTFGDGATGSGAVVEHTFPASGSYEVTLEVTDGQETTATSTSAAAVAELSSQIAFVASSTSNRNAATHPTTVPADTQVGDLMVLLFTSNSITATVTAPAGWTQVAAGQSTNGVLGRAWTKVATATDLGRTVTPTSSTLVKAGATLLVYRGVDTTSPVAAVAIGFESVTRTTHTTPQVNAVQNGLLVSYWGEKLNVTDVLSPPDGVSARAATSGTSNGNIASLAVDSGPLAAGPAGGLIATGGAATNKTHLLSLVLRPAGPVVDQLPSASFVTSCENRVCAFDASGSSDAEGPIEDFAWTFGDGGSASGAQVSHTFAADGDFDVTLTVEDGAGQSAQSMQSIRVEHVFSAPVASFTMECSSLTCVFDGSASSDADGPLVGYAWTFGDGATGSGAVVEHTFPASGSYEVTLEVTDGQDTTVETTQIAEVEERTAQIDFVGAASSNRNAPTHPTAVPAATQVGDLMVLLFTSNSITATVTAPAGWTEVAAGQSTNGVLGRVWTKVATATDLGRTVTPTSSGYVKANATLLVYRGVDTASPIAAVAASFQTASRTTFTTPAVTAVADGILVSYWGVKANVSEPVVAPPGVESRAESTGTGAGNVSATAADSGPLAAGPAGALTASTSTASSKAFLVSLVLRPAG